MENFDILGEAVDAAVERYRQALQQLIVESITKLTKEDPKSEYKYHNAMGQWGFIRKYPVIEEDETYIQEDDEFEPEPVFTVLVDAESKYGYQILPWSIVVGKGGKVKIDKL